MIGSENVTTDKIISKYFTSSPVKDDSLSDFQVKKPCIVGPKNLQKKSVKIKTKRKKGVKGQKDIRTALKTNNVLVKYTKDFDNACKEFGVDIDSEQLQLAIALSKSLHNNEESSSCKSLIEPQCSQDKAIKIRKTLQEYGFTVPDIKIVKKSKKYKKSYKLLLTSEITKKQIISDKYTQVLLQNFDSFKCTDNCVLDHSDKKLYYISTNITYNEMKDTKLFCAINSVEILQTLGNLLRDWSKIPGRPKSPSNCRSFTMNFSEIDCSQDELDILLSGSLKATKQVIKNKTKKKSSSSNHCSTSINQNKYHEDLFDEESSHVFDKCVDKDEIYAEIITSLHEDKNELSNTSNLVQSLRNNFAEIEKNSTFQQVTETASCKLYNEATLSNSNDLMEMTDCVDRVLHSCPLSIDLTKDCVSSNKYQSNDIEAKIDLTPNNNGTKIDLTLNSDKNDSPIAIENINVENISQKSISISCTELPSIQMSDVCDNTIIINDEDIQKALHESDVIVECGLPKVYYTEDTNFEGSRSTRLHDAVCDTNKKSGQNMFHDCIHKHYEDEENCSQNIDLTQSASESGKTSELICKNSLGKKDNISIDYDDLNDDNLEYDTVDNINKMQEYSTENVLSQTSLSNTSSKYLSQHFNVFELSDQELNYSINKSKNIIYSDDYGDVSDVKINCSADADDKFEEANESKYNSTTTLPLVHIKSTTNINEYMRTKENSFVFTPKNSTNIIVNNTPDDNFIIKTDQITPMLDYSSMTTPERNKELDRYGLKPFKRKRAVQLLTYLYNQTHPVIESCSDYISPSKKRKINPESPKKISETSKEAIENEIFIYEVTKVLPDIKAIECPEEDWVFQKREKAKIHSCRLPLHIAFHNYVSCRQRLREAILQYEPVNIDVIYKDLVSQGHRYDSKDLLRFLDKKCITVKTAENNGRNKKSYNHENVV
ncbi:hypothetical protein ACJJTC_001901 [Scirpophaga incertulas]